MIRDVLAASRRDRKKTQNPHIRVFLNGVDVTLRTQKVDTRRGMVWLLKHNEEGRPYITHRNEIAREIRRGKVWVVERRRRG